MKIFSTCLIYKVKERIQSFSLFLVLNYPVGEIVVQNSGKGCPLKVKCNRKPSLNQLKVRRFNLLKISTCRWRTMLAKT